MLKNLRISLVVLMGSATLPFLSQAYAQQRASTGTLPWPQPQKADVEKMKTEMAEDLPENSFRFYLVGPWVCASNQTPSAAEGVVDSTISVYGAAIQRQLFTCKPRTKPVKVYLFKDHTSYLYYNQKIFDRAPGTPYGYFSRSSNAMVMNIATGGGTLLHEMVHAMAEEDFPAIPAWLNEGLGSLYEASSMTSSGRVLGVANWRLEGLLKNMKAGKATTIEKLMSLSDAKFYEDPGSSAHYATARYLMQWLQCKGKLEAFYTRIRDKKSPSGKAALLAVLDDPSSLNAIQQEWETWVKKLEKE